jgi:hypothetical protein
MSGIYGIQHQIEYTTPGDYTWLKPPGIVMVYILCIGSGGGGGSLFSQAAGTNRAGGGGGGGGGVIKGMFPALLLPDILYITVGRGGAGQVGGVGGAATGTATSIKPSGDTNQGLFLLANQGTGANQANQGAGATAAAVSSYSLGAFGIIPAATTGGNGSSGGLGSAGTNLGLFVNTLNAGGTSGGGITNLNVAQVGGSHNVGANTAGLIGGTLASPNGNNGFTRYARGYSEFYSVSGTGGAGSTSGAGGKGGNGGMGCGGGGSGGNTSSSTSQGGNGGNGYVLIQCI